MIWNLEQKVWNSRIFVTVNSLFGWDSKGTYIKALPKGREMKNELWYAAVCQKQKLLVSVGISVDRLSDCKEHLG